MAPNSSASLSLPRRVTSPASKGEAVVRTKGKASQSSGKIERVTQKLRERVEAKEWAADETLPSQSQLSKEYGVSPATIALAIRALQKGGLLHVVPGRGAFVAESTGVNGDRNRTFPTIGLRGSYIDNVLNKLPDAPHGTTNSYTAAVVQAVWNVAHGEHCPLLLLPGLPGKDRLTKPYCQSRGVEGVIFLGGESYDEAMELRLAGFPVITANEPTEATSINYVNYHHAAAVRDVVHRFAKAGHRRIGVIATATTMPGSYQKLKPDFIDALCSEGILYDINPYWRTLPISYHVPPARWSEAERVLLEMLELPEPPTAIFCWSNSAAIEVQQVFKERGISVPGDLSLVICPGLPDESLGEVSYYGTRHHALAEELVKGICETIKNPFYHVQRLLPLEFVDRGSITPPARVTEPRLPVAAAGR
ncbi:MAG TPA: substrate-binding domain-containing protein [Chthoniobacteraceae bacterium]|nr:substrate-binding domain-containing protein [Chthoniobacteraceae bacterium]